MEKTVQMEKEKQYDCFARDFQEADEKFPDITRPLIYDLVPERRLPPYRSRLLDLGCGYGKDLKYFSELGWEAHGIDISAKMLELAGKNAPNAKLERGSFEDLPYSNDYFDVVFSRYAIQHSHNVEGVLREAHRVLRDNGHLAFLVTHPMRHYFEKQTKDYWTQEDIKSVILDGKLTVEEPSHTLSEYLSPFMLQHFDLEQLQEKSDPAARKFEGFGEYPRVLLMRFRKRHFMIW